MIRVLRLTTATAWAHRGRLVLTWLAVTLGVAFVAGSLVLTDTSSRVLDDQFRTATAGVDLTVRASAAFDSAMGVEVQREPLPADLPTRVARTAGVASVRAVAAGPGQLRVARPAEELPRQTLVGTWATSPFTAYALRTGRAPAGRDEVVLDAATARAQGVTVGDTITASAATSRHLRVVGTTGVGDADGLAGSTLLLTDLPTAQALLGLGTRVSAVEVVAADGVPVPDLRSRLASSLGRAYSVASSQDAAAASADAAQQSIGYLRIALLALAGAGLVVGAFLIANTFGIVLTQRARELALLRAAGATAGQVFASVLGEALLVGLAGALTGTLLGVGGAYGLRGLARSAGLALPDGALTVTGRTLLVAVAVGTLVTVAAAVGPARRAARVAPVQAMRASEPAPQVARRGRLAAGWVVLATGLALLAPAALTGTLPGVAGGAVLLLGAVVLLGPVLAPPLARTLGRPLERLGVAGTLAREGTVRNPRRTASTAMALALALALVTFVAVIGSSVRAIAASGAEAVTAELMVQSNREEMLGGLSPEVRRRVAALPDVAAVSVTRYGHWLDAGSTSALTAVDPHTLGRVARIRMVEGRLGDLDRGGVVIAQRVAEERGLAVGDTLAMTFPRDGEQRLRVVGVLADRSAQALSTSFVLSLDEYAAHYSEDVDATVYVALDEGVDPHRARAALRAAVADFPNADVRDQAEAAAGRAAAVEQVIGLVTVLLGFAVVIALLGITNTLALSIVERTREIGLLRAVGMERVQVRAMVRAEAVLVAGVAALTGLALGLVLAAATLAGLAADNPVVIRVPTAQLAVLVGGALAAGLVAGLLPARRAARLDVLGAIARH